MGGHVFLSQPIRKENIQPTLNRFFKELKRSIKVDLDYTYLGSTGKKDISGDIDLACSNEQLYQIANRFSDKHIEHYAQQMFYRARTSTYEQCRRRAILEVIADEVAFVGIDIKVDTKNSNNGVIFFEYPQYDTDDNKLGYNVQIDINFGNVDWMSFAYYSDITNSGNIKGLHRTQLLFSLFHYQNFKFNHNRGILTKTNELITDNPDYAIGLLNVAYPELSLTEDICKSFNSLYSYLTDTLPEEQLNQIRNIYLKILDSTRCDIPEILHDYWKTNKDILKLTGKFLPDNSKLKIQ